MHFLSFIGLSSSDGGELAEGNLSLSCVDTSDIAFIKLQFRLYFFRNAVRFYSYMEEVGALFSRESLTTSLCE